MKVKFSLFMFFMTMSVFVFYSLGISKPDDNGLSDPGCSGGNCHNHDAGIVSTQMLPNMQIEVTLIGVTAGQEVAGELIDENGNVVITVATTADNDHLDATANYQIYFIENNDRTNVRCVAYCQIPFNSVYVEIPIN